MEILLSFCTTYLLDGEQAKLDNTKLKNLEKEKETLLSYGGSVVALAYLPLPKSKFPSDFEFDFYPPNFPSVRVFAFFYLYVYFF